MLPVRSEAAEVMVPVAAAVSAVVASFSAVALLSRQLGELDAKVKALQSGGDNLQAAVKELAAKQEAAKQELAAKIEAVGDKQEASMKELGAEVEALLVAAAKC